MKEYKGANLEIIRLDADIIMTSGVETTEPVTVTVPEPTFTW